jgi:O-antigen/teichoic acid export membrane protein
MSIIGIQIVLARRLPTDVFGTLLLAQSLALLAEGLILARAGEVAMFVLGRLWTTAPGRVAATVGELRRRELQWSLWTLVGVSLAAPALGWMFTVPAYYYAAFGAAIALQSGYGASKALFVVAGRVQAQAGFELAYSSLSFLAMWACVAAAGAPGFIGAVVLSSMAKAEAARRITRAWLPPSDVAALPDTASMGTLSAASLVRNASNSAANQGDVLVLGLFAPKEVVALYKVSRTLAALPGRVVGPVWSVLRPRFVRQLGEGRVQDLKRDVFRFAVAFFLGGLAVAPAAWFYCAPALGWIYGPAYVEAAAVTLILLIGNWLLAGVTGWLGTIAIMSSDKRVTVGLYTMLASLICTGTVLAGGDLTMTAAAVTASMVAVAICAWLWLGMARQ